jgi:hypothetical protein
MSTTMKAYDEVVEFIASRGPREVAEFKASPKTRERVAELLQREKAGGLNEEERSELNDYETLEVVMNLAKARARQLLAHER